jgi:hypothetical protein
MIAGSVPERFRKLAHRHAVALHQLREDRAPRRIGQRLEGPADPGLVILYHGVKSWPWLPRRQVPVPPARYASDLPTARFARLGR